MANNVNILKASFNGKLGAVYGDNSKGVAKVKAIPFSHAPTKESVKNQCRAFECLNRFSSGVAKTFWKYLSLSDRKLLRHNAVAQSFKGAVTGGVWNPALLASIIGTDGNTEITAHTVNRVSGEFSIGVQTLNGITPDNRSVALFVALMDDTGKVIFSDNPASANYASTGVARLFSERQYYVVVFRSHFNETSKKWKTNGFVLQECIYNE